MTLTAIRNDLLRKVWIEYPDLAEDYLIDDAVTAVNQALQLIWLSVLSDETKKRNLTLNITPGIYRYDLPSNVQRIVGTARFGSAPLGEAPTQGDIENYCARYLGALEEAPATPEAYFLETLNVDGDDSTGAWLWVAPTPIASGSITMKAVLDAPRYTSAQLATTAVPDVPHGYVESLLLPIARYYMTLCHWFTAEEKRASFKEGAESALGQFGVTPPWRTTETERRATA